MLEPLVSICIPTYNQELFLDETLRSCLAQTHQNLEVVIVDDCSSDETFAIAQKFAAKDKRVRAIRNEERLGLAKNWNRALDECKADYVKLVCGDDLIAPDCVKLQLCELQSQADLALVSCARNIINAQSKVLFRPQRKFFLQATNMQDGLVQILKAGTNLIGEPMCVLFRKSNVRFTEGNNYMVDLDFYTQLWSHGKVLVLPQPLASFRIHGQSETAIIGKNQFLAFCQYVEEICARNPHLTRL